MAYIPDINDISAFVEENSAALFGDIASLVAIDSVNAPAAPGAPYGPGAEAALEKALEIAASFGFDAVNCDGHIGYASIGAKGADKPYLATITHLDVVPVGNGWDADPFTMRDRDGYILGRGVIDDKGPSVLCLYALKYLKERNIPLNYEIRALLGVNEELGMADAEWYLENYPAPAFCFSPDADFPLVNGEKGFFHGRIVSRPLHGNILDIRGGVAANAVPDRAEALIKYEGALPESTSHVKVAAEDGALRLTAFGKSGHASIPKGTDNAIKRLIEFILDNSLADAEEERFLRFLMLLHSATDGSAIGIAADDGQFDPLTAVGGVICRDEEGRISQTVDSRYPTNMNGEKIVDIISTQCTGFADVYTDIDNPPFYKPVDDPAVKVCIDTYNDITGENAKPFTIGGGTYARHFPNAVSFGPEHSDRTTPEWCGTMHGPNEAASKADLLEALKVYILTLVRLNELDF